MRAVVTIGLRRASISNHCRIIQDDALITERLAVKTSDVVSAWRKILKGEPPSLSIEITSECPLRCPGCYAYDDAHLGGGVTLRSLSDR